MSNETVRPVAGAYRRFLHAKAERRRVGLEAEKSEGLPDPGSIFTPLSDFERPLWQAVLEVLRSYHLPSNWDGPQPIEVIPAEVAFEISDRLGELVGFGKLPAAWKVLVSRDGRMAWGGEDPRYDAVRYVLSVKARRITDRAPMKTVSECFGVDRQSVRNWVKDMSQEHGIDPDEFMEGSPSMAADLVTISMQKSGERYRSVATKSPKRSGRV